MVRRGACECVCVCVANDILTDRRVSTVTGVNRCSPRRCQYEIIYHNQRASTPTLAVCCWRRPPPPLRSSSQTRAPHVAPPRLHGTRLSHQPDVRGASSPEGGRLQSQAARRRRRRICRQAPPPVGTAADIFCSIWRRRRIDVVTADRGRAGGRAGGRRVLGGAVSP